MKRFILNTIKKILSLKSDADGFVMMLTLSIFLFLFILCSSIYAVGETIHQKIRLQNACDAAAYSAAVVQADGLSRMATINRAMSWTYVQMTNHQMDYITLRWLNLTAKNCQEDYDNAKKWHAHLVASFDPSAGFWASLIGFLIDSASRLAIDWKCNARHDKPENGFWCGTGPNDANHHIRLNGHSESLVSLNDLKACILDYAKVYGENGEELGKMIDADKQNIELMNVMLSVVNRNMNTAMRSTAEFVLVNMLRDPRKDKDIALRNYRAYFYLPMGQDPYSTENADNVIAQPLFAPLYNTEPCERLFLQMNSANDADKPLHALFPVDGDNPSAAYGLDHWFVRAGRNPDPDVKTPTTVRTEGALGIQRAYKDSNLNETKAGFLIFGNKVDRGNHVTAFSLPTQLQQGTGPLANILSTILQPIFQKLVSNFCDITPSAGNRSTTDFHLGMCLKASDSPLGSVALYSEYDWASAKWVCLSKSASFAADYLKCHLLTGKCKGNKIHCDTERITHKKRWRGRYRHQGYGHFHIPKWFCGNEPSRDTGSNIILLPFNINSNILPPLYTGKRVSGGVHGYMKEEVDFFSIFSWIDDFLKPSKPLYLSGDHSFSRDEYNNCAMFPDGLDKWQYQKGEQAKPAIIQGHARIYGDDKKIWEENRYIGATAKPWVLHENFFNGLGTIVIGAAMKHENPFVQLFSYWGDANADQAEKTIFAAFNPPSRHNYLWTMSAARAAVHRSRRNGSFDQKRMYQVVYDPSSDPHNLHISAAFRYQKQNEEHLWVAYQGGNTIHSSNEADIIGGCTCNGNATQFREMWNLCEQDWDATLLPLRYAGNGAVLRTNNSLSFQEMTHQERLDELKGKNTGDGRNWVWRPAESGKTSIDNANPMNPVPGNIDKLWEPLDKNSNTEDFTLENLLPGSGKQLDLKRILKQNRIL